MAEIKGLLENLKTESMQERDMFSTEKRREFFIEMLASSVDDLLGQYDPQTHNENWVAEYQKDHQDIDRLMKEKRSVDFMSAGKLGCVRHYVETELRAVVTGRSRMHWDHNILDQTKQFVTLDYAKQ